MLSMSFKNLDLEIGYDSDETNILETFYKPVLKNSVLYERLAGYFSSTTFGLAIKEIIEFIKKNGKIKLVTSIELSKQDKKIIEDYVNGKTEQFEKLLIEKIDDSTNFFKDCSSLMGWLLVNKIDNEPQLEIKIAIPETSEGKIDSSSIYHQKVGIFTDDEGNKISFEGSVNETGKAWHDNIEKFKVSKSWADESDRKRVEIDNTAFKKFWTHSANRTLVIDLPVAVKEKFLKTRPKSNKEFEDLVSNVEKALANDTEKIRLRDYQKIAIKNWINNDNRGIFEMCTGSGKTFAAMGCINRVLQKNKRLVVIIACPYTHIVEQWSNVFQQYNESIEEDWRIDGFVSESCYADYPNWKTRLKRRIRDINEKNVSGNHFLNKLIIFTTHDTLSSDNFIELIKDVSSPILLIADEVHAVGAELKLEKLLDSYDYRLGLSATPTRYFDDEGTAKLKNYFEGVVGEFSIRRAIDEKFLSPYRYIPKIVDLDDDEMERYRELTKKVAKKLAMIGNPKKQENEISSFIEGERASIIAAAEKKYAAFKNILSKINNLDHCLIYCHEKQLERVKEILFDRGIVFHQITFREPTEKRITILNQLAEGSYQAVVAINCLDEGVDIPSAKIGIILASTGNPRQYIQRRGRLLRKESGKKEVIIYDILVAPYANQNPDDILPLERNIVRKELVRYEEFAESSNNKNEADKIISEMRKIYGI
jgi:superfamily II DNA or RNA helicase